jgi:ribosomal protein L11 methyltransferase
MRWAEISVQAVPSVVEPVSSAFTEAGCAGVVVLDPSAVSSDPWAEHAAAFPALASDRCTITGYVPIDDRLDPFLADVRSRLHILRDAGLEVDSELTLGWVEDAAWAEAWKAHFKPLRVGRHFVIKPSWEEWTATPEDRVIELDPGMAFGTGTHETTRLCLQLIEDTVRVGDRVLDWGTGSGILAVGAGLMGARRIVAIDLDPVAVEAAAENAVRNALGETILTSSASIEAVPADPPFDLVIANIVADPIIAGAGELARHLRPGGAAIVSGIIDLREADVVSALEAAGLSIQRTLRDGDWRAFLLTHP